MADLTTQEVWDIFELAKKLKKELKEKGLNKELLKNKSLVMIFGKPSLRTRVSFDIGMYQMGGHTVYLDPRDTGIGVRESEADIAKVLSGMTDIFAARTYNHKTIQVLADNATVPVINALSDLEHPCQALADFMTMWEIKKNLAGLIVGYVGDGNNNMAHSLCLGAALLGVRFRCAFPKGHGMDQALVKKAKKLAQDSGGYIYETLDPKEAVTDADVVCTDTWISMGDKDKEKRLKIFKPYQVNKKLMTYAKKDAIFMHCLPAYRGNEVTADIIDGPQSVVFQEAENRLHVQKALMVYLTGAL